MISGKRKFSVIPWCRWIRNSRVFSVRTEDRTNVDTGGERSKRVVVWIAWRNRRVINPAGFPGLNQPNIDGLREERQQQIENIVGEEDGWPEVPVRWERRDFLLLYPVVPGADTDTGHFLLLASEEKGRWVCAAVAKVGFGIGIAQGVRILCGTCNLLIPEMNSVHFIWPSASVCDDELSENIAQNALRRIG